MGVSTETAPASVPGPVPAVPAVLHLESTGDDHFSGSSALLGLPRVFGGQLLAQGLVAAARTVPDGRMAHSLHAYFLSGGHPARPIDYQVDRTRDGGRMSCRTVTASQDGRIVSEIMCSFVTVSGGVEPPAPPRAGTVAGGVAVARRRPRAMGRHGAVMEWVRGPGGPHPTGRARPGARRDG